MILTGFKIHKEIIKNNIVIYPYNVNQLNPNSYDFRLGNTLKVYKNTNLDTRKNNPTETLTIPEEGIVLYPNKLYLGHTVEKVSTDVYVPIIRGKSSTGRLGLFVHITAGLIDIGYSGKYTLMLHAVQPIRIFAGMRIGQVTFWKTTGKIELYDGKYQGSLEPKASQVYKDFALDKSL